MNSKTNTLRRYPDGIRIGNRNSKAANKSGGNASAFPPLFKFVASFTLPLTTLP